MQIDSKGFTHANETARSKAMMHLDGEKLGKGITDPTSQSAAVAQSEQPVAEYSISPEGEEGLFALEVSDLFKGNIAAQNNIFNGDFPEASALSAINYEGEELTEDTDLTQLINDEGFLGANETSQRVANFIIESSGGDVKLLEKGIETVSETFEEFETELPAVSIDTKDSIIRLLQEQIDNIIPDE